MSEDSTSGPPPRPRKRAGCTGKVSHPTREDAMAVAAASTKGRLYPYRCHCGGWHLTSRRYHPGGRPRA